MTATSIDFALLSLDSYYQGYNPKFGAAGQTIVGEFAYEFDSGILMDQSGARRDIAADFYAAVYKDNSGNIVISYRGTDSPSDAFTGWPTGRRAALFTGRACREILLPSPAGAS